MDHEDYLTALRTESERFLEALADVPGTAPVPTCSDWTAADLLWHLAEVQDFWAQVVRDGADGDDVEAPPRPEDLGALRLLVARSGTALLAALHDRGPAEPCWSWHDEGGHVGWVARRQAHEALIHRVDAELTAGRDVVPPPVALAVDGVDEVLRVMVDGFPEWGTVTPDGVFLMLRCTDAEEAWTLQLGRFTGTSPTSGTTYDTDIATVVAHRPANQVDTLVSAPAWSLDRWLWGRAGTDAVLVTGDRALAGRFRGLVAESTQ